MTTKQQRDEWQRLSSLTPGKWRVTQQRHLLDEEDNGVGVMTLGADARFVAAARDAVPALLQDVVALTAERNAAVREHAATKLLLSNVEYMRDATIHGRQMERERDAARIERDTSNIARERQWKELQAARADAAAMRVECDRLLEENAAFERRFIEEQSRADEAHRQSLEWARVAGRHANERDSLKADHAAAKSALSTRKEANGVTNFTDDRKGERQAALAAAKPTPVAVPAERHICLECGSLIDAHNGPSTFDVDVCWECGEKSPAELAAPDPVADAPSYVQHWLRGGCLFCDGPRLVKFQEYSCIDCADSVTASHYQQRVAAALRASKP